MDMSDEFSINHLYGKLQILEPEDKCFSDEERLMAVSRPLLVWYGEQARILPWREPPGSDILCLQQEGDFPYRVWISEIMLQQTRVAAVKPYFERFLSALPGIRELAEVPDDQLLKLWEGLGYYSRAKNLKKAAQVLVSEYEAKLPSSYEELIKLPGIGSYTAGAIASIAYGIPVPAVDGNVLRVLSRVLASKRDILKQSTRRWLEEILIKVIPEDSAGHFNQGLIEIGAIVCVPNGPPKCPVCPLSSLCLARIRGLICEIPVKTPKKKRKIEDKTVAIIQFEDTLALRRRSSEGLLASLYEFPNVEGHHSEEHLAQVFGLAADTIASIEPLPQAKHIFSHVEWHMTGYRIVLNRSIPLDYICVVREELNKSYPLPNAFAAYRQLL